MARLSWDQREQKLLEAIRDLEDEVDNLRNDALVDPTGLSEDDVARGLQALLDGELVVGTDAGGLSTPPGQAELLCIRLAPAGRVKVQQWPSEDAREALVAALDDALARTDDPEQQTAIEQTKRGIRSLTGKVVTELTVALAKQASGISG